LRPVDGIEAIEAPSTGPDNELSDAVAGVDFGCLVHRWESLVVVIVPAEGEIRLAVVGEQ